MRAATRHAARAFYRDRGPRRGYRGTAASDRARRWAPLLLLVGELALARDLGAQPRAGSPGPEGPRAARPLARGETLAVADIAAPAGDTLASRLVGWTTRRVIAAGEVLRTPAVAPPAAVRAGERVAVVWRRGGIALRLDGTAAADAASGAPVAVRVDARRRLQGTVTAPGEVTLP